MKRLAPTGLGLALCLAPVSALRGQGVRPPDTVRVTLSSDRAVVDQRLTGGEPAYLIRIPGQRASPIAADGSPDLEAFHQMLPGAYRIDVAGGGRRIRYEVSGRLGRIPLFVTAGEGRITVAREATGSVVVRVAAPPELLAEVDLATSLPRFEREAPGALIAELSSLPSFVRLARRGALSFARLLDLAVVALILLGAVWAWRRGRSAVVRPRRGPTGGPG